MINRSLILVTAVLCSAGWDAPARAADSAAAEPAAASAPAAAPAPAPVIRRKVITPSVKLSAAQLYMRLDAIDRRLDDIQKATLAKPSALAPVQVVAPKGGAVVEADFKDLNEALYNYGVGHKKAQDLAFAGRLIMDLGLVGGAVTMARGWEIGRHHDEARTIQLAWPYYRTFSIGALTAGVSVMVGEILAWASNRAEADAARQLMAPQEHTPTGVPAEATPGESVPGKP